MNPVLVVDGVAKKVLNVTYTVCGKPVYCSVTDGENIERYYQFGYMPTYGAKNYDLSKIIYPNEIEDNYEKIERLIAQNQHELSVLAIEIAESNINNVFASTDLLDKYKNLKNRTLGLMDALYELDETYLKEDVDLSGGEEIDEKSF